MSTGPMYTVSVEAMVLVALHAARHGTQAVNGLLLGRKDDSTSEVVVESAVPMFHTALGLAPLTEAAIALITEYSDTVGLTVVGAYHANELNFDRTLALSAQAICARLRVSAPDACVLVVNNATLGELLSRKGEQAAASVHRMASELFDLYAARTGTEFALRADTRCDDRAVSAIVDAVSKERLHRGLVDMDDHFDDVAVDFRNDELKQQIRTLVKTSQPRVL
eukprot:a677927_253.p1 GENE.a677927_253~~a677927_253.p1  ORF type:complete len:232 (+),score=64.78 a677927_253:30-698(+)